MELAQTSKQTLYKHLSLWHPDYFLGEQPVTAHPTGNSADSLKEREKSLDPSNPGEMEELHTLVEIMKGKSAFLNEAGSDPIFISPGRGVRGDEISFPQPVQPSVRPSISLSLPIPLTEIQDGLRQQVQRLGWSGSQIAQFIAEKFGGRRRSELQDNDLVTLLYHLQDTNIKLLSSDSPSSNGNWVAFRGVART